MSQQDLRTHGTGPVPVRLHDASTRVRVARTRDAGITLVEIVMAVVLSSIVGAVIVAALTTSMNAANTASSTVASSIDTQLISAFLTSDARAAGGIDPTTASLDPTLGVSAVNDVAGWAGCTQSGTLAVRFAWEDRSAATVDTVVVTYAVLTDGSLARRACDGAGSSTAVLGRGISDVTVSCSPLATCTGLPEQVSLRIEGGDPAAPFDVTLNASLRAELQAAPTLTNAAQAPLVVTGASTCPVLTLGPTSITRVLGDAVVDPSCGASPISGVLTSFGVDGVLGMLGSVDDPLASITAPASCAGVSGTNPTIGSSSGPTSTTIHPDAVTVAGNVTFQPGRHVFCNGLTIAAGATVSGTGVLLHVASGAVAVHADSTVTVAPATSGPYAGIVLWSAGTQDVTVNGGATVDQLSGIVYAPQARLVLSATSGLRIGGVIAERVTIGGTGPVRIGLPIPTLTVAADPLPGATVGTPYTATAPTVSGGTAPLAYTATGLPPGLVLATSGAITGVPVATGTFDVSFLAIDASGASVPFTRTISVTGLPPAPTIVTAVAGDTTAVVSWTPGPNLGAPATTAYTVTLTATGFPTRTCNVGPSVTSCSLTGLTNGVTYAVTVTATNAIGTSPPTTTTVTPRPAVLVGTGSQLWLDAMDPDADGTAEGAAERCNSSTACSATSNVLTRWEDKSGANNDATQSTTSMAGTYVTSMPAVDFDANGYYEATITSGPDMTAFVVAQSDTSTWNTWGWLLASRRPNGVLIHPWANSADVTWHAVNSSGAHLTETRATVTGITSPHVYDVTQSGSGPITAAASLDGHALGTQTLSGQVRTVSNVTLRLGADDQDVRHGNGKYREVIVFSRALSSAERRSVQEYLARKWSIAATPAAPTAVSALAANGGALVSWTAPAWNGGSAITGYQVTAWPGGAGCTTASAAATSCAVTGLTNGTAYAFVVTAQNAVGTGAQSAESNTITPGPPPPPTAPVTTIGTRQVTVAWTAPVLGGHAPLTGYTVTATAAGQPTRTCTTSAGSAGAPATTCTVTDLVNDVAYTFSIVAANVHGSSAAITATATPTWNPTVLGSNLTWWFDASRPNALTGVWVTRSGFTVTGAVGSTRITASSGVVERVDVINGGSGYTSSPTLTITGGGGSGAVAGELTVTGGTVTRPNLWLRGSGYTSEPTVTATGGGGTGATLRARIIAPVTVGSVIRIGGQQYTVIDRDGLTLTVSPALATSANGASIEEWRVSNWDNAAPNSLPDARQATVSGQPVLGTIAGRPGVTFSGVDEFLAVLQSGDAPFDKGANWTALIAYRPDRQISWGAVGQEWNARNTRVLATASTGVTDWESPQNIEVVPWNEVDSLNGGPVRIATDSGDGSDTFNWTRMNIGGLASESRTGGWDFSGTVGEIIVVSAGLDSAAVADATGYLTAKWGQPAVVPSAPVNVTVTPADASATVAWRAANQFLSPISGYTVTATAAGQTTRTCTSTGLTCTLTGLTNGAPYTVTVTATNGVGTGTASVPVTVVTRPALLTGANARIWLDGADLDGDGWIEGAVAETGAANGSVQTWNDKSGRTNHTSAPSAAERPSAAAQTMNGLPVVTFNGSNVLRGVSAANPYGISGDRTMFVVTRRRSGSPHRIIDRLPEDNPLFGITGSNQLEVRDDNFGQYSFHGSIGSTVNATTVLTANRSGNSVAIWSNAAPSGTGTLSGSQTMRALSIGRHFNVTSTADFDIAEVILFDRALSASERRSVETYLRLKWGTTIAPDAPTNPTASQTREVVNVSWTAPADNGGAAISGYTVTASPGGATCTTATTSCSFTGLTPGTSYTFTVAATNSAGTGPSSTASAAITKNAIVGAIATSTPYHTFFDGTWLWAANDQPGTVSKINPTTGATVATIAVGAGPTDFASDGTSLWVTNFFGGTISRINMATNTVTATTNVGGAPYGIVVNGSDVWVANMNLGVVHRISTSTNAVTQTVNTGSSPSEMRLAFGSIWVTRNTSSPGRVLRINPSNGTITATINVGDRPYNLAVEGTSIWVANYGSSNIQEINPSTNAVVTTVSTGAGTNPYDVIFANNRLWVSLPTTDQIIAVDPATNTAGTPIPIGDEPTGLTYHAATNRIWVSNLFLDWVYLVNA